MQQDLQIRLSAYLFGPRFGTERRTGNRNAVPGFRYHFICDEAAGGPKQTVARRARKRTTRASVWGWGAPAAEKKSGCFCFQPPKREDTQLRKKHAQLLVGE